MNVLLVEDDPAVRGAVERALRHAGHRPTLATDGVRALEEATAGPFDAVILDLGLPRLDGLEVSRRLRAAGNRVPILMLTARAAIADRVEGLDAGADDYLVKPFALDELLARLRALERRSPANGQTRGELRFGDLVIDRDAITCVRGGREIQLSRTEYLLLELFLRNPGVVLTRTHILESVWDFSYDATSNVVDQYVAYLRRKVDKPFGRSDIDTLRGAGYRLRDPRED